MGQRFGVLRSGAARAAVTAGKKHLTHGASASARGGRRARGAGLRSSESGCGEEEWAERELGKKDNGLVPG